MFPRLALPPSNAVLAGVALVLLVPGLAGHDLWKASDAISVEIAHEMLRTGNWLLPRMVDEPWFDASPLYFWIAALLGRMLGWWLPFHGSARVASGLLFLLALWMLFRTARAWSVEEDRRIFPASALLIFLGAIGLIVRTHEAGPGMGGLAAICAAMAALARGTERTTDLKGALLWGAAFGAALGAVFLFTGPIAPVTIAIAALIALFACDEWRAARVGAFIALGLALAFAISAIWPLLLHARSPGIAAAWWSEALRTQGSFALNLRASIVTASWFCWPAWPLAAWAIWSLRDRWREPRLLLPAAMVGTALLAASVFGDAWEFGSSALLPPLALLAAQAIARLPRGAAGALDWFSVMAFTFFAALVWLGYAAIMTGFPPRIAHNLARLAPGFVAKIEWLPVIFAVLLVPTWAYLVLRTPPSPARAVTRWAAGVAMLWASFASLLLPWADYQKSYVPVAQAIRRHIPAQATCVASRGLGWAQRAALHYHGQIATVTWNPFEPFACTLLLVQGQPGNELDSPGKLWIKVAEMGRPGDRGELLRLYQHAQ